jgi:flagellar basal-body rod protein FlgB
MDLQNIPLVQAMKQKMGYLSARQSVLAQNIANADTPGYKPKDLQPLDFHAMLKMSAAKGVHLTATDPKHFGGNGMGAGGALKAVNDKDSYETTPTGNAVVSQEEMMKAALTQSDYNVVTGLYRKTLEMFRNALGRAA